MRKEIGAADGLGVFFEHLDEQTADDLAFGFGIGHAVEFAEEQFGLVGMDQRQIVMFAEHRDDLLGFAQAHQPVIDIDTSQLLTNRLMDQNSGDRAVNAARKRADHPARTDLLTDFADRFFAVSAHRPIALEPGKTDEVFVQLRTFGGVVNLGVELDGVKVARRIGSDGKGRVGRGAVNMKTRSDFRDMVAMAHPDLFASAIEPAVKQRHTVDGRGHIGAAKLGGAMAAFNATTKAMHHDLLTIADAKDRHAHGERRLRRHRRPFGKDRSGPTRKDDRLGRKLRQKGVSHLLKRMDFTINIQLTQAPRNKLRHLRAEVDDKKAIMLGHASSP